MPISQEFRLFRRHIDQTALFTTFEISTALCIRRILPRWAFIRRSVRVSNVEADIPQFLARYIHELFSGPIRVFVDFYGRFPHHGVGSFRPAHKRVVFAAGHAYLAVRGVETHAQQRSGPGLASKII